MRAHSTGRTGIGSELRDHNDSPLEMRTMARRRLPGVVLRSTAPQTEQSRTEQRRGGSSPLCRRRQSALTQLAAPSPDNIPLTCAGLQQTPNGQRRPDGTLHGLTVRATRQDGTLHGHTVRATRQDGTLHAHTVRATRQDGTLHGHTVRATRQDGTLHGHTVRATRQDGTLHGHTARRHSPRLHDQNHTARRHSPRSHGQSHTATRYSLWPDGQSHTARWHLATAADHVLQQIPCPHDQRRHHGWHGGCCRSPPASGETNTHRTYRPKAQPDSTQSRRGDNESLCKLYDHRRGSSQGRRNEVLIGGGTDSWAPSPTQKKTISYSSDFDHFVLNMLEYAKF